MLAGSIPAPTQGLTSKPLPRPAGRLRGTQVVLQIPVLRRRQHVLNLFVSPASADEPRRDSSVRGYRISTWTQEGLRYRLVSDIAPSESDELVSLLRADDGSR